MFRVFYYDYINNTHNFHDIPAISARQAVNKFWKMYLGCFVCVEYYPIQLSPDEKGKE